MSTSDRVLVRAVVGATNPVYEQLLRSLGGEHLQLELARTADDVRALAREIDIIFVQEDMTAAGGLQGFLAAARSSPAKTAPLIALSQNPQARSRALTRGATGFLSLPCQVEEFWSLVRTWLQMHQQVRSEGKDPAASASKPQRQRATILVVDDSPVMHAFVRRALAGTGYVLDHANDGLEGLEAARRSVPDLVISDIDMPNLDGYTMCSRLREAAATRDVPILILSARGQGADIERGFAVGANDFLSKPVAESELLTQVDQILSSAVKRQIPDRRPAVDGDAFMSTLVAEFVSESVDNLDRVDQDFIALEKRPGDREILARIFRAIHTLKGSCGFLGFAGLEALAHSAESLLGLLRNGELALTAAITTTLLRTMDGIRASVQQIAATGGEGDTRHDALIARLDALRTGNEVPIPVVAPPSPAPLSRPVPAPPPPAEAAVPLREEHVHTAASPPPAPVQPAPTAGPAVASLASEPALSERPGDDGSARRGAGADSKIRVNIQLLDNLMNQVGELVLARNQILQCLSSRDGRVPARVTQRLSQITTDLQSSVMRTRLQPMDIIWNRFPRTVRDLAMELGKQVDLVMEGADTELDRSLLEAIRDPMTHLVRNAIDHGIESAEERIAAGKKARGRVKAPATRSLQNPRSAHQPVLFP